MAHLTASLADSSARAVFEVLAQHAHLQPAQLQPGMLTGELGLSRLEMALALFDIEDRFEIDLTLAAGAAEPTLGQLVQEVQRCVERRAGAAAS